MEKGSASSVTEASPCANRCRMARRVASPSAAKVASSCADDFITIWLSYPPRLSSAQLQHDLGRMRTVPRRHLVDRGVYSLRNGVQRLAHLLKADGTSR